MRYELGDQTSIAIENGSDDFYMVLRSTHQAFLTIVCQRVQEQWAKTRDDFQQSLKTSLDREYHQSLLNQYPAWTVQVQQEKGIFVVRFPFRGWFKPSAIQGDTSASWARHFIPIVANELGLQTLYNTYPQVRANLAQHLHQHQSRFVQKYPSNLHSKV